MTSGLDIPSLDQLQEQLDELLPVFNEYDGPEATAHWLTTDVQELAYHCEADDLFYGGGAGGGKTDLAIGLAVCEHQRSIILRRDGTELVAIIQRMTDILGHKNGYNGQEKIWRLPDKQVVEFGSVPNAGDERKYQGRPHDLIVFDEVPYFLKQQYIFLCGWNRHENPAQRCRTLCTGNPPTTAEGYWVKEHWGPWLDPQHSHPAEPGELRWYAMVDSEEITRPDGFAFKHGAETIQPRSRTFIPALVDDNPFLARTSYKSTLQGLPEPLRSQMLKGDFTAGGEDHEYQVIPTEWVVAAQKRWEPLLDKGMMTSMGVDPSRGGKDEFVMAPRHGNWYDNLIAVDGVAVTTGQAGAGLCVQHVRNNASINVDVVGIGSSVVDHLSGLNTNVLGIQSAAKAWTSDRTGLIKFHNLRAQMWWQFREELDPTNTDQVALPPDPQLLADLTAPRFAIKQQGLLVESKDRDGPMFKRLGRSPDKGDAVVYAAHNNDGSPENRGRFTQAASVGEWTSFGGTIDYSSVDKGVV